MRSLVLAATILFAAPHMYAEGFDGETVVLTEHGQKLVKDLIPGVDEVLSFPETDIAACNPDEAVARPEGLQAKKITGLQKVSSHSRVEISFGFGEKLVVDGDTPIFSAKDKGWINASEVVAGTFLTTASYDVFVVKEVRKLRGEASVYVVEVEDHHTLFVGPSKILVHNGPIAAAMCGIACKIIGTAGCGMGAWIIGASNPGVGVLYAAVCAALDGGATTSCVATCLALPTP